MKQYDTHCSGVFDTQIAHRLLREESGDPKDQNINLNSFLSQYLGVENDQKDVIVGHMKSDPNFWWNVSIHCVLINLETIEL